MAAKRPFAAATAHRRRSDLGCRGRVGHSNCPRLLRQPGEGSPGGGRATFRRHGDPPGCRRRLLGSPGSRSLHPAGLWGLARQLGRRARPGNRDWGALQPSAGRMVSRPPQVPLRRRPGIGSWPRSAPRSAGGAAAAGSPSTQPATFSVAGSRSTVPGPSPAVSSSGCLPAGISRCASEACGGCCMRPRPGPTRCWP